MSENNKRIVAVTGANGFIASTLIKNLLSKGYYVHATVRNLDTVKYKSAHLIALEPTGTQLKFFEADLLNEGSFKEAFEGVSGVFHTASPFQIGVKDPQKDLVDPALKGTENVIKEALKSKTVQRIVLTSSVAAVRRSGEKEDYVFTEKDFNTTSTLESEPYPLSKVLAEKKAWELIGKQDKVKMVVINPSFVIGAPLCSRSDSTSIKVLKGIFNNNTGVGKGYVLPLAFACVPLETVVEAHIQGYENEKTEGRYIVSTRAPFSHAQIGTVLKNEFPQRTIPVCIPPETKTNPPCLMDATKIGNDMGLKITPDSVAYAVKQQIYAMINLGIVSKESENSSN